MFRSIRNWFIRRYSPADRFHAKGVPRPLGSKEQPASIWVAWTLDCTVLGYLVTTGRLANPVAFVFGSQDDLVTRVTHADYLKALDIAHDFERAGNETPFIFDLQEFDWENPNSPLSFILDLVLFPADRGGGGVYESSYGPIHGAMLDYQGLVFALCEERIPWGQPTSPHRRMRVPTFEAPIAMDGFSKVPDDLKSHLDQIDPLPNKNSGQSASATLTPGKLESDKARDLTAA